MIASVCNSMIGSSALALDETSAKQATRTFTVLAGESLSTAATFVGAHVTSQLTGFNADKLGLKRGVLEAGRPADVVVFDPDAVADNVLPRLPYYVDDDEVRRMPTGIEMVVVNGEVMVERGDVSSARPGKVRRWEL